MAIKASADGWGLPCINFSFLPSPAMDRRPQACRGTRAFSDSQRREKGKLDQECGVKGLPVGRLKFGARPYLKHSNFCLLLSACSQKKHLVPEIQLRLLRVTDCQFRRML